MNKKSIIIAIVLLIILVGGAYSGSRYLDKQSEEPKGDQGKVEERIVKKVEAREIKLGGKEEKIIEVVGKVIPEAEARVISASNGIIKALTFNEGDRVGKNQILAYIDNDNVQARLMNAQIHYSNMVNNLEVTKRLANESIHQARIGAENSEESINSAKINLKSAEINLDSARDKYANTKELQEKKLADAKKSAVVTHSEYLNFINDALKEINYIINAEKGEQLPGISKTLSVKNSQALINAKNEYSKTKSGYNNLEKIEVSTRNIESSLQEVVNNLENLEKLTEKTISVLEYTVPNSNFSQELINNQRNIFVNLRTAVVGKESEANASLDNLETTEITHKQNLDSLQSSINSAQNRVESAQKQLDISQNSYKNAISQLENAKKRKEQQVLSAQTSVDSAQGQIDLIKQEIADLNIKAPSSGFVVKKSVEAGERISPGQVIAQITNTDQISIEAFIPSSEVSNINKGQEVKINENITGTVNTISTVADNQTKKVKIEIGVEGNPGEKLIPETSVDIFIPVSVKSEEQSVFVPLAAVNIGQQETYVFIAEDKQERKTAKKVKVATGKTEGSSIEILSGLENGDQLIIQGNKNLKAGDEIKIQG